MFYQAPQKMLFWMNAAERRRVFQRRDTHLEWYEAHYSIWKVVRIFDLWKRKPSNSNEIARLFSDSKYSALLKATFHHENDDPEHPIVTYYNEDSSGQIGSSEKSSELEEYAPDRDSGDQFVAAVSESKALKSMTVRRRGLAGAVLNYCSRTR
jgi:hypothetical protein